MFKNISYSQFANVLLIAAGLFYACVIIRFRKDLAALIRRKRRRTSTPDEDEPP